MPGTAVRFSSIFRRVTSFARQVAKARARPSAATRRAAVARARRVASLMPAGGVSGGRVARGRVGVRWREEASASPWSGPVSSRSVSVGIERGRRVVLAVLVLVGLLTVRRGVHHDVVRRRSRDHHAGGGLAGPLVPYAHLAAALG